MSQDELLRKVAAGEPAAMRALFTSLSGRVRRIAERVLRDGADAEDVAQEVFVKLWQHAGAHDPERGSVGTWAARIARNRAVDVLRARRARVDALLRHDAPSPTAAPEPGGERQREALRAALATLSERDRRLVELMYFEGCTVAAIARRTALPAGTIKAAVRRARGRLRLLMA